MSDKRIMIEFTEQEAIAVNHFLSGMGWGSVKNVRAITSAQRRLDIAIRIEQGAASAVKKAA